MQQLPFLKSISFHDSSNHLKLIGRVIQNIGLLHSSFDQPLKFTYCLEILACGLGYKSYSSLNTIYVQNPDEIISCPIPFVKALHRLKKLDKKYVSVLNEDMRYKFIHMVSSFLSYYFENNSIFQNTDNLVFYTESNSIRQLIHERYMDYDFIKIGILNSIQVQSTNKFLPNQFKLSRCLHSHLESITASIFFWPGDAPLESDHSIFKSIEVIGYDESCDANFYRVEYTEALKLMFLKLSSSNFNFINPLALNTYEDVLVKLLHEAEPSSLHKSHLTDLQDSNEPSGKIDHWPSEATDEWVISYIKNIDNFDLTKIEGDVFNFERAEYVNKRLSLASFSQSSKKRMYAQFINKKYELLDSVKTEICFKANLRINGSLELFVLNQQPKAIYNLQSRVPELLVELFIKLPVGTEIEKFKIEIKYDAETVLQYFKPLSLKISQKFNNYKYVLYLMIMDAIHNFANNDIGEHETNFVSEIPLDGQLLELKHYGQYKISNNGDLSYLKVDIRSGISFFTYLAGQKIGLHFEPADFLKICKGEDISLEYLSITVNYVYSSQNPEHLNLRKSLSVQNGLLEMSYRNEKLFINLLNLCIKNELFNEINHYYHMRYAPKAKPVNKLLNF